MIFRNLKKFLLVFALVIMMQAVAVPAISAKGSQPELQQSGSCGSSHLGVDVLFHWSWVATKQVPIGGNRFEVWHLYRGYRWYAFPPGFHATDEYYECFEKIVAGFVW